MIWFHAYHMVMVLIVNDSKIETTILERNLIVLELEQGTDLKKKTQNFHE